MKYQDNFSKINESVLDKKVRRIKAQKIVAVIRDFASKRNINLNKKIALDIGGSAGYAANELSRYVRKVVVIDIDKQAIKLGKKKNNSSNITYKIGDAMNMPFDDKSIDIIICNQVYEHVPDYHLLAKEMLRVLKDDGFCYFGGGNRLIIMEKHYNLLFLSWFPKKISNMYLRLTKKGDYFYENLLSYFGLKKLLKDFTIVDYSIEVIKNPSKYYALDLFGKKKYAKKIPRPILRIIKPLFPGFIFILVKNENTV